jgi:DNA-binding XRE family transcriptional regulator
MFNRKQFSEDLFMFRTAKGLSRATAAKEIGIHSSTVQTLEENVHEPRISVYYLCLKWMEKPIDFYFN